MPLERTPDKRAALDRAEVVAMKIADSGPVFHLTVHFRGGGSIVLQFSDKESRADCARWVLQET